MNYIGAIDWMDAIGWTVVTWLSVDLVSSHLVNIQFMRKTIICDMDYKLDESYIPNK